VKYIHDVWNMPAGLQKMTKVQIGGTEIRSGFEEQYPRAIESRYTSKQ